MITGAAGKARVPARPARGSGGARATDTGSGPAVAAGTGPDDPNLARFRETGGRTVMPTTSTMERRPPPQEEITRVISNNKAGIKICYQRALLRDSSLTHGKITVRVSIGISGRVKNVGVDGPSSFRALEPCIRDMLSRWAFPPSPDGYDTEFSYVFQGNE